LGLFRAGQACAAISGRDYVIPDDIKFLAPKVLSHRIVINPAARLTEITQVKIVNEILMSLPIPGADLEGEDR
jgi:MoxR-like ATPase